MRTAWDLTIRDGFGQTETTALVGNSPLQPLRPGSMGRPLRRYRIELLCPDRQKVVGRPGEGELVVALEPRPLGVMVGCQDDAERTAAVMAGGHYRTGDETTRDADGYYHYVGRGDDVFKSFDYRVSPFELERALLKHEAVAEAAVVPAPDPLRGAVPKAFVVLRPGVDPGPKTAASLFSLVRKCLAPYLRIRRIEFAELPKTISGKIRRVALRQMEAQPSRDGNAESVAPGREYRIEAFPE